MCMRVLFAAVLMLVSGGCLFSGHGPQPLSASDYQAAQEKRLRQDLAALAADSDAAAFLIARKALNTSRSLAISYGVGFSARLHNFLVRTGFKKRGLCCHWTQDLLQALKEVEQQYFVLYWAVSNLGELNEHSSIVVAAAGGVFDSGIVLDPWRYAGDLYWAPVRSDSYKWQRHPQYTKTSILQCAGAINE